MSSDRLIADLMTLGGQRVKDGIGRPPVALLWITKHGDQGLAFGSLKRVEELPNGAR